MEEKGRAQGQIGAKNGADGRVGAGAVLFLHDYRRAIALAGLAITIAAVYFNAEKI